MSKIIETLSLVILGVGCFIGGVYYATLEFENQLDVWDSNYQIITDKVYTYEKVSDPETIRHYVKELNKILDDITFLGKIVESGQLADEALTGFFETYQNKLDNLLDVVSKDRKTYHFGAPPLVIDADSTVADGADTNIIEHLYGDGLHLSLSNTGTQTIIIPSASTAGMGYGYDQTNDEGVQWVMSQNTHKGNVDGDSIDRFTVGSAAFYAEMTLQATTVAGTDDCAFGLRKVEAFQANVDDYDEMAALNLISGNVKSETIINGGATSTSATLKAVGDATSVKLGIFVAQSGKVTLEIDGAAATDPSFTFDNGEIVTPFFYQLQASGAQTVIILEKLTVGRQ